MTRELNYSFKSQEEDFDYCEAIIKAYSKTFYFAFSRLSEKKAKSIYAVYAFCREADDIVDRDQDLDKLDELLGKLKSFEQGEIPDEPIFRALAVVFSEYDMDIQPFFDMLVGQKNDLTFTQPTDYKELEDYAYYVAGSVGLMLLPILSENASDIQKEAIQLGEAMQITNILRDVGEDYKMQRIYLPKDMMVSFGVNSDLFTDNKPNQAFVDLWESLAQTAEKLYDESNRMLPFLDEEAREPLLLASVMYREILNEVRRKKYVVFNKRQYVSKWRAKKLVDDVKKQVKQMS